MLLLPIFRFFLTKNWLQQQNQLNITLQQIEKTKKLVDAGSVARGNLLQIEAQAAQEELQLINMKNQLEIPI